MIVGEKAPDFTLHDHTGRHWSLSAMLADGPVVLFFYPKASSPICTAQACHFRDLAQEFAAVGAQRVGISTDSVDKQAHFAQQRSFDYPLLADPTGVVCEQFGVRRGRLGRLGKSVEARHAGRHGQHLRRRGLLARLLPVRRTTFVIDTDRTILTIVANELRAAVHADQALWLLRNRRAPQSELPVRDERRRSDRGEQPVSRPQIRILEGDPAGHDDGLVVGMCDTGGGAHRADLDAALSAARHSLSQGDLWANLSALWVEIAAHGDGGVISLPVIGGGVSTGAGPVADQEAIRVMILSLMFASRSHHVCDELRILVRPERYERLDLIETHAFIASFGSSTGDP